MVELEPSGCDGAATLLVSGLVLADADAGSVACAAAWWSALLAAHIPMVEIEPSAGAACTAWIIAVDLPAKTSTRCCIYPTPKPIYPTQKLIYIHFSDKKSLMPPLSSAGGMQIADDVDGDDDDGGGGDADSWELFGLLPTLQEKQQLPEIWIPAPLLQSPILPTAMHIAPQCVCVCAQTWCVLQPNASHCNSVFQCMLTLFRLGGTLLRFSAEESVSGAAEGNARHHQWLLLLLLPSNL